MDFDPSTHSHRRLNPLTGDHILVSPHRTKRPWLGQTEAAAAPALLAHDPACYLCPGNTRAGGQRNPAYTHTFIFENDFAAVVPPPMPAPPAPLHPLLTTEPVSGGCDVVIFHPRHDLTLPQLLRTDIERIVDEWVAIYLKRGREDGIRYVQIFENKGAIMGCSNPHPHGQVWSLSSVPTIPSAELASLLRYSLSGTRPSDAPRGPKKRPCLLCEYAHIEIHFSEEEGRVVVKNDHWVVLVPWWATWPFETLVLPYRRHIPSIAHLTAGEKSAFADIIANLTTRYDNLFRCSFAYSMGIHQRPIPAPEGSLVPDDEDEDNIAHVHLHFDPPLLRSATVRKFLVGFELMAEAQRDITPEQAAKTLRACSEIHYLNSTEITLNCIVNASMG